MSACKSKTELVAIYRLEFYKKQKNWKLSGPRQDKKSSKKESKKKPNLNTTYKVENAAEKVSDQLNEAFIQTEPENNDIQPSFPKTCELSQEWQTPVNIWPQSGDINIQIESTPRNNKQNPEEIYLKYDEKCQKCEDFEEKPKRNGAMQRMQELLKLCCEEEQNAQNLMRETEAVGCTDCDGSEERQMQSALVLGAHHIANDIWAAEADAEDMIDGDYPEDLANPDPWLQLSSGPTSAPELEDDWEARLELAADSFGEFARGAHAAPHSSEADISQWRTQVDAADVSFSQLSRLSSQQLLHAAELHSRVLHKLLLETEYRKRLRSSASSRDVGSLDRLPTRDLGPDTPPPPPRGLGRGRGRLAHAPADADAVVYRW